MNETGVTQWVVARTREIDMVPAQNYTITTSGALVLTNGSLLEPQLVIAYAPGEWVSIQPYEECECGGHDH